MWQTEQWFPRSAEVEFSGRNEVGNDLTVTNFPTTRQKTSFRAAKNRELDHRKVGPFENWVSRHGISRVFGRQNARNLLRGT